MNWKIGQTITLRAIPLHKEGFIPNIYNATPVSTD